MLTCPRWSLPFGPATGSSLPQKETRSVRSHSKPAHWWQRVMFRMFSHSSNDRRYGVLRILIFVGSLSLLVPASLAAQVVGGCETPIAERKNEEGCYLVATHALG